MKNHIRVIALIGIILIISGALIAPFTSKLFVGCGVALLLTSYWYWKGGK